MICLELEPEVARWKAQTNPLSFDGTPKNILACDGSRVIVSLFIQVVLCWYQAGLPTHS